MKYALYQVDAFTNKPFAGNPAAVCPLDTWLADETMQAIAQENNLSETAFFVPVAQDRFHLRWFTPDYEIDLCGHATLASAFTLFHCLNYQYETVNFVTLSGELQVRKTNDGLQMDFPARIAVACDPLPNLDKTLNLSIKETLCYGDKYIVITDDNEKLRHLKPNFTALAQYDFESIIISSKDKHYDFISRYFNARETIKEDPVTGSAHCILAPYWAQQLNKNQLHAYQASPRGGELHCEVVADRILISGEAVLYLKGEIYL